jgi:hypothetical protein
MGSAKHDIDSPFLKVPDKSTCQACISEIGLKDFVFYNGYNGRCTYCKKLCPKVCDLGEITRHIYRCLKMEYEEVSSDLLPFDKETNNYVVKTYKVADLLVDLGFDSNAKCFNDVIQSFPLDSWCSKEGLRMTLDEEYFIGWQRFSELVQRKFRYTFMSRELFNDNESVRVSSVSKFLLDIASLREELLPDRVLPVGSNIYRARCRSSTVDFELNLKDIGPPGFNVAANFSNRMSPAGIIMFYGAFDENTALREVAKNNDDRAGLAVFETLKDLTLIDFSNVLDVPSIFDENLNAVRPQLKFLRAFANEISKKISSDEFQHVEYVPTQIVTEFFRLYCFRSGSKIDGIIYPSAANHGGVCIVLFLESSDCTDNVKDTGKVLLLKSVRWHEENPSEFRNLEN